MDVFDLFARISLDTAEYDRGLSSAGKKLSSFASGLENIVSGAAKSLSPLADGFKFTESVGKKAGNTILSSMKAIGAASTVVAGSIAAIGKSSFDAYADYEQLTGGIETLFKSSADRVMDYADNAYKTAGLSANEYMELTTSFSASLLQSLEGDTAAAADMANLAITDMSDNINKMGSTAQSVQDAYRGFAKQNFTMLDNLKLGYGGTKEEMQRLLADAEKIKASQGELASYSIDSYADIVKAIHVVQTEMGITGTTALEASTTIQGSIASAKGAWKNFMVGIADSNQDMTKLMDNLVESVVTAGRNVVPRIQEIVDQVLRVGPEFIRGFAEILPEFAKMAGEIIKTLINGLQAQMPAILESGKRLVGWIADGIIQNGAAIATGFTDLIIGLVDIIGSNSNKLVEAGMTMVDSIASGFQDIINAVLPYISDFIPLLVQAFLTYHKTLFTVGIEILGAIGRGLVENKDQIMEMASTTVRNIALAIGENAPAIIDGAIVLLEALANAFVENWPLIAAVGTEIIAKLVQGISSSTPTFIAAIGLLFPHITKIIDTVGSIGGVVGKVVDFVTGGSGIGKVLSIGKTLMSGISGLFSLITAHPIITVITAIVGALIWLWNNCEEFREAVKAIWDAIVGFFQAAGKAIQEAWSHVVEFFQGVWDGIVNVFKDVGKWFTDVFTAAWNGIKKAWDAAVGFFKGIWQGIVDVFQGAAQWFGNLFSQAWAAIKSVWDAVAGFFSGIAEGIRSVFSSVMEAVSGFFTAAWEAVKGAWNAAVGFFSGIWEGISGIFQGVADWFGSIFSGAWEAVTSAWSGVKDFFSGIWETITGAFSKAWDVFTDIGGNIVKGLWNGITSLAGWLWDKVSGWVQSIWDGVLSFFDINSPSGKFEWIGQMDVRGLGKGFDKYGYLGIRAVKKFGENITDAFDPKFDFPDLTPPAPIDFTAYARSYAPGEASDTTAAANATASTVVNIYSPKAVDPIEAAREWRKTTQQLAMGF